MKFDKYNINVDGFFKMILLFFIKRKILLINKKYIIYYLYKCIVFFFKFILNIDLIKWIDIYVKIKRFLKIKN